MDIIINEFFVSSGMSFLMTYVVSMIIVFSVVGLALWKPFKQKKTLIALLFFVYLVGGFLALGELLSRPKPVGLLTWAMPEVKEAYVLGSLIKPKKAIYILYMWKGMKEPRYVIYPWNEQFAKKLQAASDAMRQGHIQGIKIENPFKFETSLEDRKLEIHPIPWPKMPDKKRENQDVINLDTTG